jgi:hypothetical protein
LHGSSPTQLVAAIFHSALLLNYLGAIKHYNNNTGAITHSTSLEQKVRAIALEYTMLGLANSGNMGYNVMFDISHISPGAGFMR